MVGHPVNCATGNQVVTQTDLHVGGRGPGLHLTRTYNSRLATKLTGNGSFGYGWRGSYSAHLLVEKGCYGSFCSEFATAYDNNGSSVLFARPEETVFEPVGPLVQATLVKVGSTYVYTLPNQTKMTFDSNGRLSSEADRNGNALTMNRNGEGRLESVTDPAGRKMTFTYNSEGLIESVKDPLGNTVKYTYEGGNLVSVTEPGESKPRWSFKYDKSHQLTTETDGRGNAITTEYDSLFRVISQADALKHTRKWEYIGTVGVQDSETFITEPNGSVTRDRFNLQELPTGVGHGWGLSYGSEVRYEYDGRFNLKTVINPRGYPTTYTYDEAGNRTSETNPDEDRTEWAYDGGRNLIKLHTPKGETTTITRDGHGNALTVSRPAPGKSTQTTSYQYDAQRQRPESDGPPQTRLELRIQQTGRPHQRNGPRRRQAHVRLRRRLSRNLDHQPRRERHRRRTLAVHHAKPNATRRADRSPPPTPWGTPTNTPTTPTATSKARPMATAHTTNYTYDADNQQTKTKNRTEPSTETEYDAEDRAATQRDGNKDTTKYIRNLLERSPKSKTLWGASQ